MQRTRTTLLATVLALTLLTGCGDDDEAGTGDTTPSTSTDDTATSSSTDDTATSTTAGPTSSTAGDDTTTSTTSGGGVVGDCPTAIFTGEMSRQAAEEHVAAELSGDDIVDGIAYGYGGSNYTIYIADHEIDRAIFAEYDQGNFSTDNAVVAEPGGVLATMFALGDSLEPGTTIEYGSGTPAPIIDSGGGSRATTMGASGELVILGVDEERICFEVDYRDDLQAITGTVSAEIHQGD
jgi:hypothetical protein